MMGGWVGGFDARLTKSLEEIHRETGIVRRTIPRTMVRPSLGTWWGKKKTLTLARYIQYKPIVPPSAMRPCP